jgi:signal transduction histidine kinase
MSVLIAATPCRAQTPLHWRVFTSTDGLRESWISDVTVGPSGRVWIAHGSVDSLTVYDGYTFRQLPSPGANLKLREGPTGQVWALLPGTGPNTSYRGVQLLDGQRWVPFPLDDVQRHVRQRWQFVPWARDRVLLLTPDAIVEFDRTRSAVAIVRRASDTGLSQFTDLAPAADGGAWVGGVGGLLHLAAPGHGASPAVEHPLPAAWRRSRVVKIQDGARRGVFASVDRDGASASLAFGDAGWREVALTPDRAATLTAWPGRGDAVWVASVVGRRFRLRLQSSCCRQDVERVRALSGILNAVEPLPDGGFWLATSLGLVRHAPAAWHSPPELATLEGAVGGLLETSTGDLYALHDDGLLRRRASRWELVRTPTGLIADPGPSTNLAELPDGRIVVSATAPNPGRDVTLAFDPARASFTPVLHPEGRAVRMLGPRAPSGVWVATTASGRARLEQFDGQRFTPVLETQSAWAGAMPRTILQIGGDDLAIVPDGAGIGWLRGGRYEVLGPAQGYPGSGSFAAFQVDRTRFWFGDRDGIIAYDGTRWEQIRTGLQTVRGIVRTRDGSNWVTSGSGLHRFRDGGWLTVAAPEGLPDGSVNHLLEDRSGTVWVSTTAGLSRYVADADRDPPETSLDAPGNPAQAPPSGNVRFDVSGKDRWNLSVSERLLYAWRLDAGPWSPPEARSAVVFEGLRPGRHRLEVRAVDRNWNVDPSPAVFEFKVLLPWYREPGFIIVGALGSLGAALALGLFLSRHVRLERLVAERTAALRSELADRQRIEQERAILEGQLHQSQKLEAIGRLAGGIAHDFNNLLTVITGFAELVRDEVAHMPSVARSIDEINKAAQRAASLTRQVLAFSRQQIVDPKPLDLNEVLSDIEPMLRRLIGEDIALSFLPAAGLWPVLADRGQFEQVIVNVAVNARDAMPDGGQLTIATSNVELDDVFVGAHVGTHTGPHVMLAVTDTGVGIDAAVRTRIFEPFFTTKPRDKGTGLGLATVYGIVAQAGGHIWVESEAGQGTIFRIYVPRTEGAATAATSAGGPATLRGSERILVVEDDHAVQEVAATALRRLGYAVEVVSSAEGALLRLDEPGAAPDLVLTDVVLGGMSGLELGARARQQRPTVRVLFMSGYADSALVRKGSLMRGAFFIQKPFTTHALSAKVREVLDTPPGP